jgi:hypothetical protein
MDLTLDQREQIAAELKRFSTELALSDTQKDKLKTVLTEAYEKLQEFRQNNPNVSKEELAQKIAANRSALRERVVAFLSAQQLITWDAEMAKAKEFLGQKAVSA